MTDAQALPGRDLRGRQPPARPPVSARSSPSGERTNSITSGHRACRGCGEALGARVVLDAAMHATGGRMVTVNATGCLEVFSTPYPESAWRVPWLHSLFGNAAAVASGVAATLRAQGRDDVRVVAQAGDGGTVDIGLGCLSGMFERNDDVLFVCYDNQGYMNTGVQRSGATPAAANTANTRPVGTRVGNAFGHRQEPAGDRDGARDPLRRHGHGRGPPRPGGQGHHRHVDARRALPARAGAVPGRLGDHVRRTRSAVARLAAESGLFPVFEAEDGEVTAVHRIRRQAPVEDYLRLQTRFAHLFTGARPPRRGRPAPAPGRPLRRPLRAALGECIYDHRPSRSPSPSARGRAAPTSPARGAPSARCTSTAPRPAATPARPVRVCATGSTSPSPAVPATRRPGGRSWRSTRCRPLMGRVCYRPCETACNRGLLDESVGINSVERFLGDEAIRAGLDRGRRAAAPTGKHVLVVGFRGGRPLRGVPPGPGAGTRSRSRTPAEHAGGMMRYAIPLLPAAARGPRCRDRPDRRRSACISSSGPRSRTSTSCSRRAGFDAVFLALGARIARRAYLPAGTAGHVLDALSVLRSVEEEEAPLLGRRVAVYGGGNTALDTARTAKRLGADVGRRGVPAQP